MGRVSMQTMGEGGKAVSERVPPVGVVGPAEG